MTTTPIIPTRPDRPAWTAAKGVGDVGELLVARVLARIGLIIQQHKGNAPHDLTVDGKIEVKTDKRAEHTGNVAVEVAHRNKPSGITISTASGWAFVVGSEILLTTLTALRALIERGGYRKVAAGEDAVVVLVPIDDIRGISMGVRT